MALTLVCSPLQSTLRAISLNSSGRKISSTSCSSSSSRPSSSFQVKVSKNSKQQESLKESQPLDRRSAVLGLLATSFSSLVVFPNEFGSISEATEEPENALIKKLLEQSKANKEKNDQERIEDFNRRNYGDYFRFLEGSIRKSDPSPAEKEILEWLDKHKRA